MRLFAFNQIIFLTFVSCLLLSLLENGEPVPLPDPQHLPLIVWVSHRAFRRLLCQRLQASLQNQGKEQLILSLVQTVYLMCDSLHRWYCFSLVPPLFTYQFIV